MIKISRIKIDGSTHKYDNNNPRATVAFLGEIQSIVKSSGADIYINDKDFDVDVIELTVLRNNLKNNKTNTINGNNGIMNKYNQARFVIKCHRTMSKQIKTL